jgi:hypothetical protein
LRVPIDRRRRARVVQRRRNETKVGGREVDVVPPVALVDLRERNAARVEPLLVAC